MTCLSIVSPCSLNLFTWRTQEQLQTARAATRASASEHRRCLEEAAELKWRKDELERAQAQAAEEEDFERAADLGDELDALLGKAAAVQVAVQSAEAKAESSRQRLAEASMWQVRLCQAGWGRVHSLKLAIRTMA